MKRYFCYIYGAGKMYNQISNRIHLYKEYIKILGILTTDEPRYEKIDGISCYKASKKHIQEADYIIIAVENWKEIYSNLKLLGANDNQIIRYSVFDIPYFDFNEYIKLKKSSVSILANSCLAGRIYKELGLPVLTPTVNASCLHMEEFADYVENISKYKNILLQKCDYSLEPVSGSYNNEIFIPAAHIDHKITWLFPHTENIDETIDKWNKKTKVINLDNLVIVAILYSDLDAYMFEAINVKKKIGFYYKDLKLSSVVYIQEWEDKNIRLHHGYNFAAFVHRYVTNLQGRSKIDWIKFLNGYDDYLRY